MKVFKCITNGSVSYHPDARKAVKTNPQIILQDRGLIVNTH